MNCLNFFGGLEYIMSTIEIIFGAVLLFFAVFLVIAVLLQQGKSHNLGTIAGGAETFFGKEKGKTIDKVLSTLTSIVSAIFVIAVAVLYVLQS